MAKAIYSDLKVLLLLSETLYLVLQERIGGSSFFFFFFSFFSFSLFFFFSFSLFLFFHFHFHFYFLIFFYLYFLSINPIILSRTKTKSIWRTESGSFRFCSVLSSSSYFFSLVAITPLSYTQQRRGARRISRG